MKNKIGFWAVILVALLTLWFDFTGSAKTSQKLVKVGGMKNHCDCTYRIE